ncbi:hypothetical protein GEMRC1_002248 [Eukaryota sp. GEM-RC1]
MSARQSDVSSRSPHARTAAFSKKAELRFFEFLRRLLPPRAAFIGVVAVILEVFQVVGFIVNSSYFEQWDSLLDPRSLFEGLALRLSTKTNGIDPSSVFYVCIAALYVLLIITGLLMWFPHNGFIFYIGCVLVRLFSTVLFVPFLANLLPALTCLPSNADVSFHSLISPGRCWNSWDGLLIKLVTTVGLILYFLLCYCLARCSFDPSPSSKRVFARSHSYCHTLWLIMRTCLLLIYFLLPYRNLLFHSVYFICSCYLIFRFVIHVPFYNKRSNYINSAVFSLLPTSSLTLLISTLYTFRQEFSPSTTALINMLLFFSLYIIISSLCILWTRSVLNRYYNFSPSQLSTTTQPLPLHPQVVQTARYKSSSIGLDLEDDDDQSETSQVEVATSFCNNEKHPSSSALPTIRYPFQSELYTRFLFPKPHKSSFEDKEYANMVYEHGSERFPESVDLLLFKCNFEIFIKDNFLAIVSLFSLINNLDVDLTLCQRYFLHYYQKKSEELRRISNTGDDYVDAKSSISFHQNLKNSNLYILIVSTVSFSFGRY